jgi:hypothetical protein
LAPVMRSHDAMISSSLLQNNSSISVVSQQC